MNNNMTNIFCCNSKIENLYNIDEEEIYKPIELFSKNHNIKFNYNKKDKLVQNDENDNVINYFIKSSKDISIIFVYPKALNHPNALKKMYEKLNKNGKIFYEKNIDFTMKSAYNLIFQLYFNEKRMKTPFNIIYKVKRIGIDEEKGKQVRIIVYKHKNNDVPIGGNSSPFKMELRQLFYDEDKKKIDEKELKLYDYIHVNNDDNQAYVYAGILFNKNSIRFLEKQNSWKIYEMIKSIQLLNKFKNFIHKYGIIAFEHTILFSSSILFSYGLREMNDIDGYMVKNNYIKIEDLNTFNRNDIDLTYDGSSQTNEEWLKVLDDRAKGFGANNFDELAINPKYHYYFMGVKFLRLKYDVITRLSRGRPAQITDLLVLRQLYDLSYKLAIPKITKMYDESTKKDIEKPVDYQKFLDTVKYYLKKRYFINLSLSEIKDWIENYKSSSNSHIGGGSKYIIETKDISNEKYVYPTKEEAIKMGYIPKVSIYSDDKPFLYPGELFKLNSILKFCDKKSKVEFKKPFGNNLSIMSFNVHNFITRCNSGISPVFNTINPYTKARDIKKFIDLFKTYSPDILCLQEVVPILNRKINEDIHDYEYIRNNFNFKYLNELMAEIGYEYKVVAKTRFGNLIEKEDKNYYFMANAIYSKIKINKYKINQFSFIDRNFIHINFNYKKKNIDLINVHLEYFETKSINYPDIGNVVLLQHKLLKEYIENIDNKNIIICGDFNINIINKLPGIRYNDYELKTKYLSSNFNISNYFKIPTNFSQETTTDYILVKKDSNFKSIYNYIVKSELSDHYPIIAYLKFNQNINNHSINYKGYNDEKNSKSEVIEESNWNYYKNTLNEIQNIMEYYKKELIKYYSVHIHKRNIGEIDKNVLNKNMAIFTYFNNIPNKFHPLPKYIYFNYSCYITFINPMHFNLNDEDIIVYDEILNKHTLNYKFLQDKAPYNEYKKNIAINLKYFDIKRYLSKYYIIIYTDKSKLYHITKSIPNIEGDIIYVSILRRFKSKELEDVFESGTLTTDVELYSFNKKNNYDTVNWFSLKKNNMLNDPYNIFYKKGEEIYKYTAKLIKNVKYLNLSKNIFLKGHKNLDTLIDSNVEKSYDDIYNGFINYINDYDDNNLIWKKNKGKRLFYEIIYKNSNFILNNIYFFDFLKTHGYILVKYSLGFYEKTNKFYDYEVGIDWDNANDFVKIIDISKVQFIPH